MLQRYAMSILLLALPLGAEAQITLDTSDYPFQLGDNTFVNLSTSNEDGANTTALEALIAQAGPAQTYDMTGITFEDELSGTIQVDEGAAGPAAEAEPLDQATLTASFPFVFDEEGTTAEGTIYFYNRVTEEAAYELGSFFLGEADGKNVAVAILNTPDGRQDAAFPYTFGSMWSSAFTQVIDFSGFEITSDVSETSEVDGWGRLVAPGLAVSVLRVKVTTEITTFGSTSTTVCYEFRSAQPVAASVCEGNTAFEEPPTATLSLLGSVSTETEESGAPVVTTLAPAYPNPARDVVTLEYVVPKGGAVELTLYDVLGRPVRRVVEGARSAGPHTETLDVYGLAPGVYVARLTVNGQHWTRRVTIAR